VANEIISDDILIDILSGAAERGIVSIWLLRPLLQGFLSGLYRCPDSDNPHVSRWIGRVTTPLAHGSENPRPRRQRHHQQQLPGPFRWAAPKPSAAFLTAVQKRIADALALKIHSLARDKTAGAAIELGSALAAFHALRGLASFDIGAVYWVG
jgi:hypothetical protein